MRNWNRQILFINLRCPRDPTFPETADDDEKAADGTGYARESKRQIGERSPSDCKQAAKLPNCSGFYGCPRILIWTKEVQCYEKYFAWMAVSSDLKM